MIGLRLQETMKPEYKRLKCSTSSRASACCVNSLMGNTSFLYKKTILGGLTMKTLAYVKDVKLNECETGNFFTGLFYYHSKITSKKPINPRFRFAYFPNDNQLVIYRWEWITREDCKIISRWMKAMLKENKFSKSFVIVCVNP